MLLRSGGAPKRAPHDLVDAVVPRRQNMPARSWCPAAVRSAREAVAKLQGLRLGWLLPALLLQADLARDCCSSQSRPLALPVKESRNRAT